MRDLPEGLREFLKWRTRSRKTSASLTPAEPPQGVYARLIKDRVSPSLRAHGLQGSGGKYSLRSESHWALLGFQKSAYSDRSEVRFTVNLMVVRRDAWDALVRERPDLGRKPSPSIHYGEDARSVRIGDLVEAGIDKWWRIFPGQDVDAVESDLLRDLLDVGVPWLRRRIAETSG